MRFAIVILLMAVSTACSGGQVERLERDRDALEEQVELLQSALAEANNRIRQAADDIGSAQLMAFGDDCENLELAVQMLDEPETVREP